MKLIPIDCKDVILTDGFWKKRQDINKTVTEKAVYDRFDETGRIRAFQCVFNPNAEDKPAPHFFWDSDVAKWIEGASYILMHEKRPDLEERIDWIVEQIEKNRTHDGYYNLYFIPVCLQKRFTDRNLHELYCAGHHFEAACAYYHATGKDKYLRMMEDFASLLYRIFVEEHSACFDTPGHPEIELALMTLYRTTRNEKWRELCRFFIEMRGNSEKDTPLFHDPLYASEIPVKRSEKAEGHCVRLNYLMSGACDLAYETDDEELFAACDRVFRNATEKRMYITGAQGSSAAGERYTIDYHLPNKSAYAETCASISLAMYARRMELYRPDSRYGDVVERTLYNGILSGVSVDGDSFFYENPLEMRDEDYILNYYDFNSQVHRAPRVRQKMFGCSCCPPNIVRLIASVGGYIYSLSEDKETLFVHQYIASEVGKDGVSAKLETEFPSNGKIRITASGVKQIAVRIPYYASRFTANAAYTLRDGYAFFDAAGGTLELRFDLSPRFVYANTRLYDNIGRTAVMYGPIVYCAENVDNGGVENFAANTDEPIEFAEGRFGVPELCISGVRYSLTDALYSETPPQKTAGTLRMIPYFAFANRGESEMLTYLPVLKM